jgi:hypothetical protein
MPFELGDKVRDPISKLEGIVTGRTVYLWGCIHCLVNPGVIKDGAPVDATWFDEDRLELVERAAVAPPASAAERAGCPASSNVSR